MFPYPVINCQGLSNLLGLLAVRLNELETALIYNNRITLIHDYPIDGRVFLDRFIKLAVGNKQPLVQYETIIYRLEKTTLT